MLRDKKDAKIASLESELSELKCKFKAEKKAFTRNIVNAEVKISRLTKIIDSKFELIESKIN